MLSDNSEGHICGVSPSTVCSARGVNMLTCLSAGKKLSHGRSSHSQCSRLHSVNCCRWCKSPYFKDMLELCFFDGQMTVLFKDFLLLVGRILKIYAPCSGGVGKVCNNQHFSFFIVFECLQSGSVTTTDPLDYFILLLAWMQLTASAAQLFSHLLVLLSVPFDPQQSSHLGRLNQYLLEHSWPTGYVVARFQWTK